MLKNQPHSIPFFANQGLLTFPCLGKDRGNESEKSSFDQLSEAGPCSWGLAAVYSDGFLKPHLQLEAAHWWQMHLCPSTNLCFHWFMVFQWLITSGLSCVSPFKWPLGDTLFLHTSSCTGGPDLVHRKCPVDKLKGRLSTASKSLMHSAIRAVTEPQVWLLRFLTLPLRLSEMCHLVWEFPWSCLNNPEDSKQHLLFLSLK